MTSLIKLVSLGIQGHLHTRGGQDLDPSQGQDLEADLFPGLLLHVPGCSPGASHCLDLHLLIPFRHLVDDPCPGLHLPLPDRSLGVGPSPGLRLPAADQARGLPVLDRLHALLVLAHDPKAAPTPGPHLHAVGHFRDHDRGLEVEAGIIYLGLNVVEQNNCHLTYDLDFGHAKQDGCSQSWQYTLCYGPFLEGY